MRISRAVKRLTSRCHRDEPQNVRGVILKIMKDHNINVALCNEELQIFRAYLEGNPVPEFSDWFGRRELEKKIRKAIQDLGKKLFNFPNGLKGDTTIEQETEILKKFENPA